MKADLQDVDELLEAAQSMGELHAEMHAAIERNNAQAMKLQSLTSSLPARRAYLKWADDNITVPGLSTRAQAIRNLLIHTVDPEGVESRQKD